MLDEYGDVHMRCARQLTPPRRPVVVADQRPSARCPATHVHSRQPDTGSRAVVANIPVLLAKRVAPTRFFHARIAAARAEAA